MENKYYKPESHEFRVGLECEILEGHDYNDPEEEELWMPYVWSEYDYAHSVGRSCGGTMREIRVKYLDREDIESIEFMYTKDKFTMSSNRYYKISAPESIGTWLEIHIDDRFSGETTIKGNRGNEYEIMFRGVIKNKSELSIILKQVGMS